MKFYGVQVCPGVLKSPPSRGAWIEIKQMAISRASVQVAPLAGGVD